MKNYLSIDQGTTSSRSIIFNSNLEKQIDSQLEYKLDYPDDGWVELRPDDVVNTVKKTIANVLDNFNGSIEACGITNQRETTIVWSRDTGEPIYPGIVWQDRRTNEYCQELKSNGYEKKVSEKTGLVLDPYFSATKVKWILDNVEGAKERAQKGLRSDRRSLFAQASLHLMNAALVDRNKCRHTSKRLLRELRCVTHQSFRYASRNDRTTTNAVRRPAADRSRLLRFQVFAIHVL